MPTPKIKAEDAARFAELQAKRKDLEREARAIGKEESALADDFKKALEDAGQTTCVRGGYRVSLVDGRPSVSWKSEFIEIAGATKAHEIEKDAPIPKRIEVSQEAAASTAKRKAA